MLVARIVTANLPTGRDSLTTVTQAGRSILLATVLASVVGCAATQNSALGPFEAHEPYAPFKGEVLEQPGLFVNLAPTPAVLMINKDIDLVRLQGVLGSAEQVLQVRNRANELFGAEMIINDLVVDPSVADVDWFDSVLHAAENLGGYVDGFTLTAGGGQMTVGGSVDSKETADQIAEIASNLAGLNLAVSSSLVYPTDTSTQEVIAEADAEQDVIDVAVGEADIIAMADVEQDVIDVAVGEADIIAMADVEQDVIDVAVGEADIIAMADVDQEIIAATVAEQEVMPMAVTEQVFTVVADAEPTEMVEGISIAVVPLAVIDQQAVAVQQVSAQPIAAISSVVDLPESIVILPASVKAPEPAVELDTDGDGIADSADACVSRAGYPVNERGCQSLDGYLEDVSFDGKSNELTAAAKGALDIIAFTMLDHPVTKIAVLSYSLEGEAALMKAQARERAFAVVDYLVAKGVSPNRLQAFALSHRVGLTDQIMIKEVD